MSDGAAGRRPWSLAPNASSKVLGDEFQDFLALAVDLYCFLSHPWFLHQCLSLNCISYRFVEQDLHRFVSWHEALSDQRAIERDRRGEGRHVVSRVIELVHRWLFTRPPQAGRPPRSPGCLGDEDAGVLHTHRPQIDSGKDSSDPAPPKRIFSARSKSG